MNAKTFFLGLSVALISIFCLPSPGAAAPSGASTSLNFNARKRVETNGAFHVVREPVQWAPGKTAIIVCDMWDKHWCEGASTRVAEMAPRMNEALKEARRREVLIIHAPSDTMKFYEGTPQRKKAQQAKKATPPQSVGNWMFLNLQKEGPLPIDDSDGGCDDEPKCAEGRAWSRQIATLEIFPEDAVSADGNEIYNLLAEHGIENVIILGVHTNMCVLGRPFSIRQMVGLGKNVLLMRDMTDTMYNSRMKPFVNHFTGTDLVVEHIEKHWCGTITSDQLIGGEPFRFKEDTRKRVTFVIGEDEYDTGNTLPQFARTELEPHGLVCDFVHSSDSDPNNFAGLESMRETDLIVLSVRRRTPLKPQLDFIRRHLQAGKALVGIRTASHAFDAMPPDDRYLSWPTFDSDILGYKYEGHYGNKPPNGPITNVKVVPEASTHPALAGLGEHEFRSTSHLYKNRKTATTVTPLLVGQVEGNKETQPVAWVHTGNNRRVFYTSLGNRDDFQSPPFKRLLVNGIFWSLGQQAPTPKVAENSQQSPTSGPAVQQENQSSASTFAVADDLVFEQVLAEPVIRQPVFLNFDERGRMWVVQYLQYPNPAGLKMMSRDNVWRAVYDKVPPPPPNHFRGADKITIHEDTNGDGEFDNHKTFVDGLNIVTSVTRGRGGVWVLNPPYLLFYADKNNDDVPDGDPEVHLAGFGLEDTHSVANSLRWGPDGWLYGAQGSTVTGNIVRPGLDTEPVRSLGQLIWRYHPETRRYEIFAEGGGNAFGVEIDSKGRIFSGHNGGNTRGFDYPQGGYLQKGFEKHGPLSNPHAYGFFPPMPHGDVERFTHTFVIYESDVLPQRYHGKLFGLEPLQGRIVLTDLIRDRSSFRTVDLSRPVTASNDWFRPVDIKEGPDGALYICDWHDRQVNHYRNHEGQIDTSSGRIYRLKGESTKQALPQDLAKLTTVELIETLKSKLRWNRETAIRLLADRRDRSAIPSLNAILADHVSQFALEALWALNASGGFTSDAARKLLGHRDPHVRLWTVRLLGDQAEVDDDLASQLAVVASTEPHLEVRGQLASSARRLPASQGLPIIRALLNHSEDASDNRMPLFIWWAIESSVESDRAEVLAFFKDAAIWTKPLAREHILERMMRRLAQRGAREDLIACANLLKTSPDGGATAKLLAGFNGAFSGRAMPNLPEELLQALAKAGGGSVALRIRQGDRESIDAAINGLSTNSKGNKREQIEVITALGEVKEERAVPKLLRALDGDDADVQRAAITALQNFDDPTIGEAVAAQLPSQKPDVRLASLNLLASRATWTRNLVELIGSGQIPKADISQDLRQKIESHDDPQIATAVAKLWAGRPNEGSEYEKLIQNALGAIEKGSGNPYEGQKLYTASCAACHKLYGHGGEIGPDLTMFQRDNLETMLLSIVNPNAEIREGYENQLITTKDDRAISGFLVDQDKEIVALRGTGGETFTVKRADIAEMEPAGMSLMPEGLLTALDEQQVRDLFAYLRMRQPLVK